MGPPRLKETQGWFPRLIDRASALVSERLVGLLLVGLAAGRGVPGAGEGSRFDRAPRSARDQARRIQRTACVSEAESQRAATIPPIVAGQGTQYRNRDLSRHEETCALHGRHGKPTQALVGLLALVLLSPCN